MNIKLLKAFYIILLKSKLEYRFNFIMEILINFFTYIIDFAMIWVLMQNFNLIIGWNYYQLVFIYNMNLFSYGVACLFFYIPFRSLETMVKDGSFELLLVRPISPFFHLLLKQNYLGFLSHIILGIIMFIVCFQNLEIVWRIKNIVFFVIALLGAILIQSAIMIFTGSLSVKYIRANSLMNVLIYDIRSFIQYPINIYPKSIRFLVTFVIPYAFVNYYPAQYLFNFQFGSVYISYGVSICGLLIGVLLFGSSIMFFNHMINVYQGVGN